MDHICELYLRQRYAPPGSHLHRSRFHTSVLACVNSSSHHSLNTVHKIASCQVLCPHCVLVWNLKNGKFIRTKSCVSQGLAGASLSRQRGHRGAAGCCRIPGPRCLCTAAQKTGVYYSRADGIPQVRPSGVGALRSGGGSNHRAVLNVHTKPGVTAFNV